MLKFAKIIVRNILQGPSTDPFPFAETFTPERLRGKVTVDPDLCMGCGVCVHTCAAGAIKINARSDNSGHDILVWHNSCCLCANCRHYCPTKAITLTNDWHNAQEQKDKFNCVEQQFIPYVPCTNCNKLMKRLPLSIAKRIYANNKDIDYKKIITICSDCRVLEDAARINTPNGGCNAEHNTK